LERVVGADELAALGSSLAVKRNQTAKPALKHETPDLSEASISSYF